MPYGITRPQWSLDKENVMSNFVTIIILRDGNALLCARIYAGTVMTKFVTYRKVSNIRRAKSQYLNDSHLVLQSSLSNPLKQGIKLRMKM